MILGIGTDIIEVSRIELAISRQGDVFLNQIFTPSEQEYCNRYKNSALHYAGRYAAKEAILKATGFGLRSPITWLDMEILNNSHGQPIVYLSGELSSLLNSSHLYLSISHCKSYATAFVVLEKNL